MRFLTTLVLALVLGACASTNLSPNNVTTPAAPAATVVTIGEKVQTKGGNYVRVYAYQSLVRKTTDKTIYVAADVEGCAGPHPVIEPGVSPAVFFLEMPGRVGIHTVASVKQPALNETTLAPNHCARGWVTFHINKNRAPQYVVFIGTDVIKWRIR